MDSILNTKWDNKAIWSANVCAVRNPTWDLSISPKVICPIQMTKLAYVRVTSPSI